MRSREKNLIIAEARIEGHNSADSSYPSQKFFVEYYDSDGDTSFILIDYDVVLHHINDFPYYIKDGLGRELEVEILQKGTSSHSLVVEQDGMKVDVFSILPYAILSSKRRFLRYEAR